MTPSQRKARNQAYNLLCVAGDLLKDANMPDEFAELVALRQMLRNHRDADAAAAVAQMEGAAK